RMARSTGPYFASHAASSPEGVRSAEPPGRGTSARSGCGMSSGVGTVDAVWRRGRGTEGGTLPADACGGTGGCFGVNMRLRTLWAFAVSAMNCVGMALTI
ncbi:MAG: hypothetical protein Q4G55_12260, partial [bacterium]|nr:hypothetical protein [bacterium]